MITKDNNLKVMELFFKYPYRTFHIREIARLTKLSSTGIIKIIKRLKKEKLLILYKTKLIDEIKPDFEGNFLFIKRIYNIYSLKESNLIDHLKKYYELPKAIVLFGSYSNGTDSEQSDIDLALIGSLKNSTPDLSRFESILARKINLHIIDLSKTTKEFKNSLANGIVLEGFIEII